MTPTDAQWDAVKEIVAWYKGGASTKQVFYLAGYAGTGKSTILKLILQELRRWGMRQHCLMTFTGKAASVCRKKGNPDAMTAHAGLYMIEEDEENPRPPGSDLVFTLNMFGKAADADLLVFEECSMIDEVIGGDALSLGKKVLVLGDPGQLKPVRGEGFFTKMEPDIMLTEVHRQALESPILRLATLAREGEQLPFGTWITASSGSAAVVNLNMANEPLVYREDTQTICGVHRVRKTVTARLRARRGFGGMAPMAGERIICGKNNRERNLFNGLQGDLLTEPEPYRRKAGDDTSYSRLIELNAQMDDHHQPLMMLTDPWMFEAHFGDVEQPRMRKNIEWADFGYILTCHKAQGSEWEDVTVIDDGGSFGEDRHRWRYTALTRASDRLTILRR